jgi:hypothetical protein
VFLSHRTCLSILLSFQFKGENEAPQTQEQPAKTEPSRANNNNQRYSMDDFHFLKVLGKGSFGKVRVEIVH